MNDSEFEQQLARMRDGLPRFWWAIYEGCQQVGFTPEQSMALVQTWLLTHNSPSISPPSPPPPPRDKD